MKILRKKLTAAMLAIIMMLSPMIGTNVHVNAEEKSLFPYTLFASSDEGGAITFDAGNICINGGVATNGTCIAKSNNTNININGTKTENANIELKDITSKLDKLYFNDNVDAQEDIEIHENNINITTPTKSDGDIILDGNVNIQTALKAEETITFCGEVKNTEKAVIYSQKSDIIIDSENVNLNGLIYSPNGTIYITAKNLTMNNVVMIAEKINISCPSINANYSRTAAELVGDICVKKEDNTTEDTTETTEVDTELKDEDGNGIPDYYEDMSNWDKLDDTDGDGLPDVVEGYIGTDGTKIDTDGDGLGDYYEIYYSTTDPLKTDTDDNGVTDGDEDFDEDGLSNMEEYNHKTMPFNNDTDYDGLLDGEEVNKYKTNPADEDTDADGLKDGDEINFNTNPLEKDADGDGVPDGDELFEQEYIYENEDKESQISEVKIELAATGNINETMIVENISEEDNMCAGVVGLIGDPYKIETSSDFEEATISYKVNTENLGDTEFEDLMFLWYDEENYEFVELETNHDEKTGMVSTVTSHFSRYMIVDSTKWFAAWNEEIAFDSIMGGASNTVFAYEQTRGLDNHDEQVDDKYGPGLDSKRALICDDYVKKMGKNDKTAIISYYCDRFSYTSTNKIYKDVCKIRTPLTADKEKLKNGYSGFGNTAYYPIALDTVISKATEILENTEGNKNIIMYPNPYTNAQLSDECLQKVIDNNIKIYVISFGHDYEEEQHDPYFNENLTRLTDATGGEYIKIYDDDSVVDMYSKIGIEDMDNTDTDGDGLIDLVELSGIRIQNGSVIKGCDYKSVDTDGDGLKDNEEIVPEIKIKSIPDCVEAYLEDGKYYYKMISEPTWGDSDGDGYNDYDEIYTYKSNPLVNEVKWYRLNHDYVSINKDGNYSYGGNQGWFKEENDLIENSGCGLIAAADTLLYMSNNKRYKTAATDIVTCEDGIITLQSYKNYIEYMEYVYFSLVNAPGGIVDGIDGARMSQNIDAYGRQYALDINAKWCISKKKILVRAKEMIENDIPVIMSVGPMGEGEGVRLYSAEVYNNRVIIDREEGLLKNHYVIVTAINEDFVNNCTWLELSSWGKKYYIEYKQYLDEVEQNGCFFFSNILYIRSK